MGSCAPVLQLESSFSTFNRPHLVPGCRNTLHTLWQVDGWQLHRRAVQLVTQRLNQLQRQA